MNHEEARVAHSPNKSGLRVEIIVFLHLFERVQRRFDLSSVKSGRSDVRFLVFVAHKNKISLKNLLIWKKYN